MQVTNDVSVDFSSGNKRKTPSTETFPVNSSDQEALSSDPSVSITWEITQVAELECIQITLPDANVVATLVIEQFHPLDFQLIAPKRPHATIPLSIARLQYSEWIKLMRPDDELTPHQMVTVANYVNLLYMETSEVLKDIYSLDMKAFVDSITAQYATFVCDQGAPHLQEYYTNLESDTWGTLTSHTSEILALLQSDFTINTGAYLDNLRTFAHCIAVDMALTASQSMQVQADTSYLTATKTAPKSRHFKLLDSDTLADHPALQTYQPVNSSSITLARTIVRVLRTDGTPSQHPPSLSDFSTITMADSAVHWLSHTLILGFEYLGDFNLDQDERLSVLQQWIPRAKLDSKCFFDRYYDNANAIVRNAYGAPAGFVYKLETSCLFGTIKRPAPFVHSLYSASCISLPAL